MVSGKKKYHREIIRLISANTERSRCIVKAEDYCDLIDLYLVGQLKDDRHRAFGKAVRSDASLHPERFPINWI